MRNDQHHDQRTARDDANSRASVALALVLVSACFADICTGATAVTAPTHEWQNHSSIEHAARQFIEHSAGATASELTLNVATPDPRLQLAICPHRLEGFWPANARTSGNTVVGVRCPLASATGWQVFLPVSITELQSVWVAARPLQKGEVLSRDNLSLTKLARAGLRGTTFARIEELEGSTTRQHIAAAEPITAARICLVCRGDQVTLTTGSEDFKVRVRAIAESSANRGERISVVNPSTKRRITAVVLSKAQVTLP